MKKPGGRPLFGRYSLHADSDLGTICSLGLSSRRPKEFVKQPPAEHVASSDEEESRVGKMPSSDESESD